jgi:hypothetical protein
MRVVVHRKCNLNKSIEISLLVIGEAVKIHYLKTLTCFVLRSPWS